MLPLTFLCLFCSSFSRFSDMMTLLSVLKLPKITWPHLLKVISENLASLTHIISFLERRLLNFSINFNFCSSKRVVSSRKKRQENSGVHEMTAVRTTPHPMAAINPVATESWEGIQADSSPRGGGCYSTMFCTWMLRPMVQTLNFSYTTFAQKGTPFTYLQKKMVPLLYTNRSVLNNNWANLTTYSRALD